MGVATTPKPPPTHTLVMKYYASLTQEEKAQATSYGRTPLTEEELLAREREIGGAVVYLDLYGQVKGLKSGKKKLQSIAG